MSRFQVIYGRREGLISDDQLDNEHGCQKRLQAAIIEMTQALEMVNTDSSVMTVNMNRWNDFLHDDCPDYGVWDERIERARG
jgi:hypothetical protein